MTNHGIIDDQNINAGCKLSTQFDLFDEYMQ